MTKAAIICENNNWVNSVFTSEVREKISDCCDLYPDIITSKNINESHNLIYDLEIILGTWYMIPLSEEQILKFKKLKALFYGGGSVKYFAKPYLKQNLIVTSAWKQNAKPVAEFTLAHILLANKGVLRNQNEFSHPEKYLTAFKGLGNFKSTVSILGFGQVGKLVAEYLSHFEIEVIVYDPIMDETQLQCLGVKKVSLEEAFIQANVVSNHLPDLSTTKKIIGKKYLEKLQKNASFINTGRGATINEQELIEVFGKRKDLTAILDVTDPEPPPENSKLYTYSNIFLTSHIAGSIGNEMERLGIKVYQDLKAWIAGEKINGQITLDMWESLA